MNDAPELLRALQCTHCGAALRPSTTDQHLVACGYCGRSYALTLPARPPPAVTPPEAVAPPPPERVATPPEAVAPPAPANVAPPSNATTAGPSYRDGEAVEIDYNGSWYGGRIVAATGPSRWLVTYDGYGSSWDEEVGPDRLRRKRRAPVRAVGPELQVGQVVEVEWNGNWYGARVLAVRPDGARVHYEGYSESWDEDVGWDRFRALRHARGLANGRDAAVAKARADLLPGDAIEILWGTTWYPGRALLVRADGVRGRYDDYDESWDEDLPWDRVRVPA